MKKAFRYLRRVWVGGGLLFMVWLFFSFQAQGFNKAAVLTTTASVAVRQSNDTITFEPTAPHSNFHFLFLPGGMVEPAAYTPLAKSLAAQGIPTTIVAVPWRGAPIGFDSTRFFQRLLTMTGGDDNTIWILGGHSRGAALAAQFVHDYPDAVQGLVLVGTTHPKESARSLVEYGQPVIKIYASEDEVASVGAIDANRVYLPANTQYVLIAGGNHAQFGWYGTQLGDGRATISREAQQQELIAALLTFFEPWTAQ